MSSTDTNGGHQVISHLGIVQLCVPCNLTIVKEYPFVIAFISVPVIRGLTCKRGVRVHSALP